VLFFNILLERQGFLLRDLIGIFQERVLLKRANDMDHETCRQARLIAGRPVSEALLVIHPDDAVHERDGPGRAGPDTG